MSLQPVGNAHNCSALDGSALRADLELIYSRIDFRDSYQTQEQYQSLLRRFTSCSIVLRQFQGILLIVGLEHRSDN